MPHDARHVGLLLLLLLLLLGLLLSAAACSASLPEFAPAGDAAPDTGDGALPDDGVATDGPAADGGVETVIVAPAYPTAPAWLDHVKRSDPSRPSYDQPGKPCDPAVDVQIGACVHAGDAQAGSRAASDSCVFADGKIVDVRLYGLSD